MVRTADAWMTLGCARPLEEGDDRTRLSHLIAKIEVIAAGIIEVDRLLDKPQAEHLGIEIYRSLCIRTDDGDMVYSLNGKRG